MYEMHVDSRRANKAIGENGKVKKVNKSVKTVASYVMKHSIEYHLICRAPWGNTDDFVMFLGFIECGITTLEQ